MEYENIEMPKGGDWIALACTLFFVSFTFFLWDSDSQFPSDLSVKKVLLTKTYWKREPNYKNDRRWLELAFTDFQQNMTLDSYFDLKIDDFKEEISYYDSLTIKYRGNLIYSLSKNGKEYIEQSNKERNKKAVLFWGACISLICLIVGFIKHNEKSLD